MTVSGPLKESQEGQEDVMKTHRIRGVVGAIRMDREVKCRGPGGPTIWERVVQAR